MGRLPKDPETASRLTLGPGFPIVPVSGFAPVPKEIDMAGVWKIIGPTVEKNMNGMRPVPLWKIFCVCYAQGMENAVGLMMKD